MPKIGNNFTKLRVELTTFAKSPWIIRLLFCTVILVVLFLIYKERTLLISFNWTPNLFFLFLSLVSHSVSLAINYLVWHLMVKKKGGAGKPLLNLYAFAIATISRRIPTPIWYLGSRFVIYSEIISKDLLGLLSLYEIFLLGSSGAIATFTSLSFNLHLHWSWLITGTIIGTFLFLLPFFYPNWIAILLTKIISIFTKKSLPLPALHKADYFMWWWLYFVSWVSEGIAITFTFFSFLPSHPNFYNGFTYALLSTYIGFISQILPAGLGIKEIIAGILFQQWLPTSVGIVIALIYRLLITLWELLGSFCIYRIWQRSRANPQILPKSY